MTQDQHKILEALQRWQKAQAVREGVEGYRVLPYKTLVALAQACPTNELELLSVKGIGAIKARQYGAEILRCIQSAQSTSAELSSSPAPVESNHNTGEVGADTDTVFVVGEFLSALNVLMRSHFSAVRVRGEVVDFRRNHSGHAYFQIKDASAVLRVTVFRGAYEVSGVELADGMEIIVTGYPQHHAQYGFSFLASTVELCGEGALKKAYDALKTSLRAAGLLDAERKRALPPFVRRIGLITSRDGAAIGDFMTNLGAHGFHVLLRHSAVEGQQAVHELLRALADLRSYAQAGRIDVAVITRGGGSLESLQAFNNETFVRAVAEFPVPVVAGIGHERDETLTTLVADVGVSTPTAAARVLSAPYADAVARVERSTRTIMQRYAQVLRTTHTRLTDAAEYFVTRFRRVFQRYETARAAMMSHCTALARSLQARHEQLARYAGSLQTRQAQLCRRTAERISQLERLIAARDPHTLLARGYAIVRTSSRVVRTVADVTPGEELNVRVSDGTIHTVVRDTKTKSSQ